MSQNPLVINNGSGFAVRTAINDAIDTLETISAGGTQPPIKPGKAWSDTNTGLLKIANSAGSAFLPVADFSGTVLTMPHGQCVLEYVSATQLRLRPQNGNMLHTGQGILKLPAAGVTQTISGLTANTAYNVYAVGTTGTSVVPTLEITTAASARDPNSGIWIRSGSTNRALVGWLFTTPGGQLQGPYTRSLFNDGGLVLRGPVSGRADGNTFVNVGGTVNFLLMPGESYVANMTGWCTVGTLTGDPRTTVSTTLIDTTSSVNIGQAASAANGTVVPVGIGLFDENLTSGIQVRTVRLAASAGAVAWFADYAVAIQVSTNGRAVR